MIVNYKRLSILGEVCCVYDENGFSVENLKKSIHRNIKPVATKKLAAVPKTHYKDVFPLLKFIAKTFMYKI